MFCVEYNYGFCTNGECDQPHWCAICFKFGHNAREHRVQPLSSPTVQETIYFFGGWRNPQLMMYHNLWLDQAKGTSKEGEKAWRLVWSNGHLHGHTSIKHYLLAIREVFTLACFFLLSFLFLIQSTSWDKAFRVSESHTDLRTFENKNIRRCFEWRREISATLPCNDNNFHSLIKD